MAKAILELQEMPESCWQCPCIQNRTGTYRWCGAVGGDCPNPPYKKKILICLASWMMKYDKVSGNEGFHTYSLPASKSLVRR